MRHLRNLWRSVFDVREGEYIRTSFMALYLFFVLFAYYILKPVSRALFLTKFDIDRLPYLYILIACGGGLLAYLYTKVAVRASLTVALTWTTVLSILCLIAIWWMLQFRFPWMLYVFNVWVSLFSIVLVSQGWLIAANVFTAREAKRVYGILGLGAVVGAAFGGTFTSWMTRHVEPRGILLASAGMVGMSYLAFLVVLRQKGVRLTGAKAAEAEDAEFEFADIVKAIGANRHLQVIMGIITLTFIVDVLVEFQFSAMAKASYTTEAALTAFLGSFYGIYLNLVTFVLQFFLTTFVVSRFGVGGTLQIMPVAISITSLMTIFSPSLLSTAAVRLTEAATRYSFNKTGMELLYLPLPMELKNRTKAFVDIFVDRFGRGLGAVVLLLFAQYVVSDPKRPDPRQVSYIVLGFVVIWILLSVNASREYSRTVRKRLESRRLNLEDSRVRVTDSATVKLLEQAAMSPNARQASYALGLLGEAAGYDLAPQLRKLVASPSAEVRSKVFELARAIRFDGLLGEAQAEVPLEAASSGAAVAYLLALSPDREALFARFIDRPSTADAALEALTEQRERARQWLSAAWISAALDSPEAWRRALAATAIGLRGDDVTAPLLRLFEDSDERVVSAACRAAGILGSRACLDSVVQRLAHPCLRGVAIASLARYGARIAGSLGDMLEDDAVSLSIRRQIPRVLKLIPDQRSVDVLLGAIGNKDLTLRAAALKGLNRLREDAPGLNFAGPTVRQQTFAEIKYYFEMNAALAPFRTQDTPQTAASLLARTIKDRLDHTLDRMFRLLGLRYPAKDIYSAYLAVRGIYTGKRNEEHLTAAVEFLDSVVERDLKRVLMPLLDSAERLTEVGRDLLGVDPKDAEAAIRDLIRSGDPWLRACAVAAAAQLQMKPLTREIEDAARGGPPDLARVASDAIAALV